MSLDGCCDDIGCSPDPFVYEGDINKDFDETVKKFSESVRRLDAHIREARFRNNHPYVYKVFRFVGVY